MISPAVRLWLAEPAVLLRQVRADQPERAHLFNQRAIDLPARLARLIVRGELLARETLRGLLEGALLGGETHAHRYFANLRNCGLRFSWKARTPSFDSSVA